MTTQQAIQIALQHHQAGHLAEAETLYRQILLQHPNNLAGLNNLSAVLQEQGKFDDALLFCSKAIQVQPDLPEAHNNLGNILVAMGNPDQAESALNRAIALRPEYAEAHSNLGAALKAQGKFQQATAAYSSAIRLKPDFAEAHNNLGVLLLLQGDFDRGWVEREWRWRSSRFSSPRRNFPQPQWAGEDLTGKSILLHAEQGYGDAIQFVRYAPLVAARGGRVIVQCAEELFRLFQTIPGVERVVTTGVLPSFDVHCPLLSLPLAMKTRLETIPVQIPYLRADPHLLESWGNKLAGTAKRLRVGLAWAGRPTHRDDRNRSLSLSQLAPLAKVAGAGFFSLQKDSTAAPPATAMPGMELNDRTAEPVDFADTTALISHLDLVITVDTAVAHLAGALGKPTWILLTFIPDWRWLIDREDSPWYPTVRLFRQKKPDDWKSVVERVAASLAAFQSLTPPIPAPPSPDVPHARSRPPD